ncbi:mediator of RNA polymerase II transcription subunit 4 isoform X1 [Dermacentor andersoni]|uniref:mediator of RNA polymerase II transcription subunit 4 isoform X1 n=1 Tax=Dermacentor andersoni TaxID=34620 RepID=UPI0024162125|nr:uncharacterized protein LOC126542369 isoform X1 [Dermacentor andersoni]
MAAPQSTREQLLLLVDDIEIIAKELFENIIAPKNQRLSAAEHSQLAELLVSKDEELKHTLVIAAGQAEVQKTINSLQEEVEKQDHDIQMLQWQLRDAESLMSTAIYQAKQKLQSIEKANARAVSSEELIKYAHRISASNAVAAPHNWQQGDPRRPYPTDIEMRQGYLGRLSDLPLTGPPLQPQGSLGDLNAARHLALTANYRPGRWVKEPKEAIRLKRNLALTRIHLGSHFHGRLEETSSHPSLATTTLLAWMPKAKRMKTLRSCQRTHLAALPVIASEQTLIISHCRYQQKVFLNNLRGMVLGYSFTIGVWCVYTVPWNSRVVKWSVYPNVTSVQDHLERFSIAQLNGANRPANIYRFVHSLKHSCAKNQLQCQLR